MNADHEGSPAKACGLCSGAIPMLGESPAWRVVLNRNQNLLGKCMLVLARHEEMVVNITPTEWSDLHKQIRRATEMLVRAFDPDHFNYVFLQNQDRHVHLHVIPRYAAARTFNGETYFDPDYPDHYSVPSIAHILSAEQLNALADHLQPTLFGHSPRKKG